MQFCPKCDNIMDIGKSAPKYTFGNDPTSLSITTTMTTTNNINSEKDDEKEDEKKIVKIINMYKNQLDISNQKFEVDKIIKHKDFISLKDKDKKELIKILKSVEDDSLTAYVVCKNCSYSEKLIKRTLILNKMSNFSTDAYTDLTKYKYMRYDNTLPHTRDYICKNKECDTHKNVELKNAKWFRPIQNSYITYYVCCDCGTVWNIS